MDRNTETIEGIHGKVREVSTMTGTARRLIQGMEGGFVNNIKGFFGGLGVAVERERDEEKDLEKDKDQLSKERGDVTSISATSSSK